VNEVRNTTAPWQIYRTRFLIKAKPLTGPLAFIDTFGRQQRGGPGDYLIEASDGTRSIQRREIFEDIYVPMGQADGGRSPSPKDVPMPGDKRRNATHSAAST
jgi:hypothetical protein